MRVVALLATGMIFSGTAAVSGASPVPTDSPQPGERSSKENCVIVVGERPDENADSPVLYSYCSPDLKDSRAHLARPDVQQQITQADPSSEFSVMQDALLMRWHEHANYLGAWTDVWGSAGTCDAYGYRLTPNTYWRTNISSARGYGNCTFATFFRYGGGYAADF